ncbi:hypothetical protein PYH37_001221 [Sinorhizobium numidicum]|uniref:Uncharacterized protein n=1 Tax=Sinorhizobium numidicum TaxID=680248 RepID=A0ABY8CPM7_9HYPH|nr:hypothetical protein [Sinorhizobium numidicum]WEX73872.1 hypothetical protein PYH37_001221 [Sinorhizobium numidicum]WEX79857.1 hypothetical protein PYH38_001222 [Sinorhizobium numidicum]
MYGKKDWQAQEGHGSSAFPVGVLLLAVCGIVAYLVVEGSVLKDDRTYTKVYTPLPHNTIAPL